MSGEVDRDWSVVFRCAFVKIMESVQAAHDMQACYYQEGSEECPTFNVIFINNCFNGVIDYELSTIFTMCGIISVYIQPG